MTSEREYELDVLVYATGFDAVTGAFDRIDILGRSGFALRERWREGPETFLGMMVHGFPNLFMPTGPQSGSASTNYPRGIETGVDWCTALLQHMRERGTALVEPTAEAQRRWTDHVKKMYAIMLMRKARPGSPATTPTSRATRRDDPLLRLQRRGAEVPCPAA